MQKKNGRGCGLGELRKIWRFPCNILAIPEASDFTFGMRLGFAKAHHKIAHRTKSVRGLGLGKLPKFGVYL